MCRIYENQKEIFICMSYLPKYGRDRKDIEKDTQHEFSLSVERCSHHEEATVRAGGESRE